MPVVHFTLPDGSSRVAVDAPVGSSLMHAAVLANVPGIEAECGGCLSCATCHVYVDERDASCLPAPTTQETQLLDFVAAERRPNSRLSCQIVMTESLEGLTVTLPARQV